MADNGRKMAFNPVSERRQARHWSQAELAERAGISRAAVGAIEGERLSPSVATALALAAVFECSVEELFRRDGIAKPRGPQWAWMPRGVPAAIGKRKSGSAGCSNWSRR